MPPLLKKGN